MNRVVLIASLLFLTGCRNDPAPAPANESAADAATPSPGVSRSKAGTAAPDIVFKTPDGDDARIADFKGRPILVNLWASWCVPCVKELPTLERLRTARPDLDVIAVSQDMGPAASVAAFLDKNALGDFAAYQDSKMALSGALGAEILPTTILYDAKGFEVWRYIGDLDWTGAEASKLLAEASSGPAR